MVAADDPSIAGVITLAGPGVPGMEVARYQVQQPILRIRRCPMRIGRRRSRNSSRGL